MVYVDLPDDLQSLANMLQARIDMTRLFKPTVMLLNIMDHEPKETFVIGRTFAVVIKNKMWVNNKILYNVACLLPIYSTDVAVNIQREKCGRATRGIIPLGVAHETSQLNLSGNHDLFNTEIVEGNVILPSIRRLPLSCIPSAEKVRRRYAEKRNHRDELYHSFNTFKIALRD